MIEPLAVPDLPKRSRRGRGVARLGLLVVLGSGLFGSCELVGQFVEYTDGLRNSKERTVVVRGVSQTGGFLGLLASVPVTVASLPITYSAYLVGKSVKPEQTDVASMLLLPSFTLLGIGSLLGVPADVIEMVVYRAWAPRPSLDPAEQEAFEAALDEETLPRCPVEPIVPKRKK